MINYYVDHGGSDESVLYIKISQITCKENSGICIKLLNEIKENSNLSKHNERKLKVVVEYLKQVNENSDLINDIVNEYNRQLREQKQYQEKIKNECIDILDELQNKWDNKGNIKC
jgi:thiamine kinase-like enzyme